MTRVPEVTVAMSVYNAERFLAPAVESILRQSFENFELLVVNDGSGDGTATMLDKFAGQDSRLRVIHQRNRGLVWSLNRLIEEARAPLIARMDGDDISLPNRFERQIDFLRRNPDFGVVGTNTDDIDEEGSVTECTDLHPLDHATLVDALQDRSPICHPSVMMRSAVVRAAGAYRAAYQHCEDYDLWLRLSTRTKLGNLPERLLYYRRSSGQISNRHVFSQTVGAAIARTAHRERLAGRADPTEKLAELPRIDELDTLFNRSGVSRDVRADVAPRIVFSKHALTGQGFEMLARHVMDGGNQAGLWRTVARLMTFRLPWRSAKLATLLFLHSGELPRESDHLRRRARFRRLIAESLVR